LFCIPFSVLLFDSPVPDYLKATVETITKIHHAEKEGDILAFLTGQVSFVQELCPLSLLTMILFKQCSL
jgi:hypothetical protein